MIEHVDPIDKDAMAVAEEKARARRKSAVLHKFAQTLNASSVGITPKWQRAIDNYKRLKSETINQ